MQSVSRRGSLWYTVPMQEFNVIVAEAGTWGCTVARVLAESGRKVLVLKRRAALAAVAAVTSLGSSETA